MRLLQVVSPRRPRASVEIFAAAVTVLVVASMVNAARLAMQLGSLPESNTTGVGEFGMMGRRVQAMKVSLKSTPHAKLAQYCSPLGDMEFVPPTHNASLPSSAAITPDESVPVKRELAGNCPKMRHRVVSLPQHCVAPRRGEIVIKGERHSGTNWIRNIISQNTCNKCERDPQSGWKHGFLPPMGCGKPLSEGDFLLVVTRDAFTWLAKMYDRPYTPYLMKTREKGFSSFLRAQYKYESSQGGMELCKKYNDEDTPSTEKADNIIQIRTQKYKQWLSQDIGYEKNRHHLRLESLYLYTTNASATDVQSNFIGDPLNARCVPIISGKHDFRAISDYTNWEKTKKVKGFDPIVERENLLRHYSKKDLCFVMSQLDLAFEEEILGYTYDYVYDLLK